MSYRVIGLDPSLFAPLFGLSDEELAARSAMRMIADEAPGFPDRVTLRDARVGEALLLVNFEHQPAATPYRSRHAIFVLEGAREAACFTDELPPVFTGRTLSLRAFDAAHFMVDAALVSGDEIEPAIRRLLQAETTDYLHAHNAGRGCYAASIERG